MNKAMNHSLHLVPPLSSHSDALPARRARVERAAAESRAASVSLAPRTSLIDIAWDNVAEASSFPPVAAPRESAPLEQELGTPTFFHATPAWVSGAAPRSHATSTMPGLGPSLLPPRSLPVSERPLLTALIIAATVVVGFGVGFGTSFGASVGATLMRLSLVAPTAEAPLVRAPVAAVSPLPVTMATAALMQQAAVPVSIEKPTSPPLSEAPLVPVEVAVRAPARAPVVGKASVGMVGVRSPRTAPATDNPY